MNDAHETVKRLDERLQLRLTKSLRINDSTEKKSIDEADESNGIVKNAVIQEDAKTQQYQSLTTTNKQLQNLEHIESVRPRNKALPFLVHDDQAMFRDLKTQLKSLNLSSSVDRVSAYSSHGINGLLTQLDTENSVVWKIFSTIIEQEKSVCSERSDLLLEILKSQQIQFKSTKVLVESENNRSVTKQSFLSEICGERDRLYDELQLTKIDNKSLRIRSMQQEESEKKWRHEKEIIHAEQEEMNTAITHLKLQWSLQRKKMGAKLDEVTRQNRQLLDEKKRAKFSSADSNTKSWQREPRNSLETLNDETSIHYSYSLALSSQKQQVHSLDVNDGNSENKRNNDTDDITKISQRNQSAQTNVSSEYERLTDLFRREYEESKHLEDEQNILEDEAHKNEDSQRISDVQVQENDIESIKLNENSMNDVLETPTQNRSFEDKVTETMKTERIEKKGEFENQHQQSEAEAYKSAQTAVMIESVKQTPTPAAFKSLRKLQRKSLSESINFMSNKQPLCEDPLQANRDRSQSSNSTQMLDNTQQSFELDQSAHEEIKGNFPSNRALNTSTSRWTISDPMVDETHCALTSRNEASIKNAMSKNVEHKNTLHISSEFVKLLSTSPSSKPEVKLLGLEALQRIIRGLLQTLRKSFTTDSSTPIKQSFAKFVFECFRKRHGLLTLVDQKVWEFIHALTHHRQQHIGIDLFSSFLEGFRSEEELKLFVHLRELLYTSSAGIKIKCKTLAVEFICFNRVLELIATLFPASHHSKAIIVKGLKQLCRPWKEILPKSILINQECTQSPRIHSPGRIMLSLRDQRSKIHAEGLEIGVFFTYVLDHLRMVDVEFEHEQWTRRTFTRLDINQHGWLCFEEFSLLMNRVYPSLTSREKSLMFTNALRSTSSQQMSFDTFRSITSQLITNGFHIAALNKLTERSLYEHNLLCVVMNRWTHLQKLFGDIISELQLSTLNEDKKYLQQLRNAQSELQKKITRFDSANECASSLRHILQIITLNQSSVHMPRIICSAKQFSEDIGRMESLIIARREILRTKT